VPVTPSGYDEEIIPETFSTDPDDA
jgi:hypothetical protein